MMTYLAYSALLVCLTGIGYRIFRWMRLRVGPEAEGVTLRQRAVGALSAVALALLRPRALLAVTCSLLTEVILQLHILKQSPGRWLMHMFLFYGMLLLLLMHVFDDEITARLFSEYASTRNPFMLLRHLFGLLVLAGIVGALIRRRTDSTLRCTRRAADRWLLVVLAAIILSGTALEAVWIISPNLFGSMVTDYMGSDDPEEIAPLKAYWAAHFDVAFVPMPSAEDPVQLGEGLELHQTYCAACHSRPNYAFLSYPVALSLKPFAAWIDGICLEDFLWYLHSILACLALALLPFSKLLHLITTPLGLISRALGNAASDRPINRPARRAMGIDACTHCGVCSQHCAVGPVFQVLSNPDILPSEKLYSVAGHAAGGSDISGQVLLAEGSFICTACGRCTSWCPSGIDLQDLWHASKADLVRKGYGPPYDWMHRHGAAEWMQILSTCTERSVGVGENHKPVSRLSDDAASFWACVQCTTCTNVCPVVAVAKDPRRDLELTPQQIMNLMRLQLKEAAIGSRMVWDCVTCYKCQEHCPQGVRVADVIYELRNEACRRLSPAVQPVSPGIDAEPARKAGRREI